MLRHVFVAASGPVGRRTSRAPLVAAACLALFAACARTIPPSVGAWRAGLATTTTTDGHHLRFLDVGPRDGEAIVLMHGLPTSSHLFHAIVPGLVARGYRVIAPDLVGFGASDKPAAHAEYDFGRQAERVLALLDQLAIEHFSLVVHDLGALVSWELLDRQPARPTRLLVLNTTAYPGFAPPLEMRMLAGPMGEMMAAMMRGGALGPSLTASFLKDNVGHPDRVSDSTVDTVWWSLHEGGTTAMRMMAQSFGRVLDHLPRYQAALRRFEGPAMVLWGARDKILRFELLAPKFAADLRVPPERVRAIPDAGHFLMLDDPERVLATILELAALPLAPTASGAELAALRARPFDVATAALPPPGPSFTAALDVTDRVATAPTAPTAHDVRLGLRARSVLGGRPGYAFGLDAAIGAASGLAYRAAVSPIGVGYAGDGHLLTLTGGVGVHGAPGNPATLELPVTLDLAVQLGPVRGLAWARAAWVTAGFDATPWEVAIGLRLGRARGYFPGAVTGAGPYLAAVLDGAGDRRTYGLALGVELGDGR